MHYAITSMTLEDLTSPAYCTNKEKEVLFSFNERGTKRKILRPLKRKGTPFNFFFYLLSHARDKTKKLIYLHL